MKSRQTSPITYLETQEQWPHFSMECSPLAYSRLHPSRPLDVR
jgi:hypothetical protein